MSSSHAALGHLHVPSPFRRNGPDGDGHDGLVSSSIPRTRPSAASTATSCFSSTPSTSNPVPTCRRSTRCSTSTCGAGTAVHFLASIPFVVGLNDKVRIRFGNLTMTNHPIHMHGYEFKVSCTDGGWVDPAAAWDEVSIDCRGWADACLRLRGRRARRLGDPLPQVAPHDERHGAFCEDLHWREQEGSGQQRIRKRIAPGYMPMGSRVAWARWARWRWSCRRIPCR